MICFSHCYGRRDVDILRQPRDKTTLSAVALFTSPEPKKVNQSLYATRKMMATVL